MSRTTSLRALTIAMALMFALSPLAAFAAPAAQDVNLDLVGVYESDILDSSVEGSEGLIVTLSLFDDGTHETLSDFMDGEDPIYETGTWEDLGDETISVIYETSDGEAYEEPVEVIFEITEDGLIAPELTSFSEDGLVLTLTSTEPERIGEAPVEVEEDADAEVDGDVTGLYTTGILDADGAAGAALLYVNEDGTVESAAIAFDSLSLPITRLGEWVDNGDGTISITLTDELVLVDEEVEVNELDDPESLEFAVEDGTLVSELFTFYSVDDLEVGGADADASEDDVADEIADEAEAAIAADLDDAGGEVLLFMNPIDEMIEGRIIALSALENGVASFAFSGPEDEEPTVLVGSWEEDDEGLITVTLTMDANQEELEEPLVIVFEEDEDGNLVGVDYDTDLLGEELTLELNQE